MTLAVQMRERHTSRPFVVAKPHCRLKVVLRVDVTTPRRSCHNPATKLVADRGGGHTRVSRRLATAPRCGAAANMPRPRPQMAAISSRHLDKRLTVKVS